jgi:hypothetical protein
METKMMMMMMMMMKFHIIEMCGCALMQAQITE